MRSLCRAAVCALVSCTLVFLVAASASAAPFKSHSVVLANSLSDPIGVAVDQSDGAVYVSQFESDKVTKYTVSAGKATEVWSVELGGEENLDQLAVDEAAGSNQHDIYVAGRNTNVVYRITPTEEVSQAHALAAGLSEPSGVAIDSEGDFFVSLASGEVAEFNSSWDPINAEGAVVVEGANVVATESQLVPSLQDVAVSPDGEDLYTANENGEGTIRYTRSGPKYEAGATIDANSASGVALSASGKELFVDEATTKRIGRYDASTSALIEEVGTGELVHGYGLAAYKSELYVADLPPGTLKGLEEETAKLEVETKPATDVTKTTAKLHAKVKLAGGGTAEYYFAYGESTSYGADTPVADVTVPASGEVEVEVEVTGLKETTKYDYNAFAEAEPEAGKKEKVEGTNTAFETEGSAAKVKLTISGGGAGRGTVSSNPSGIDCGTTCSAEFASGTVVTLTATPELGYEFAGWFGCMPTGSFSGTGSNTCEIDLASTMEEVLAAFVKVGEKGAEGQKGSEGQRGPKGSEGAKGEPGPAGSGGGTGPAGPVGPVGPAGVAGPAGAAGPAGPAGNVELVTCKKVGKKQQCTTKVVSGTVKFTTKGFAARAVLSRHGAIFAEGDASSAHGGLSLRLSPLRKLTRGRYELTLITGSGDHEHIHSESFTLG